MQVRSIWVGGPMGATGWNMQTEIVGGGFFCEPAYSRCGRAILDTRDIRVNVSVGSVRCSAGRNGRDAVGKIRC